MTSTPFFNSRNNLRDDISCFSYNNIITYTNIFTYTIVFIMKRCALNK